MPTCPLIIYQKQNQRRQIRFAVALNVSLDEFVIDSISANTTIFEYNFNVVYKSFGKTRKDMLLNFMNYLESKKEYDRNDDENI